MIIKKVAFGNWEEAFVETRLQDRVNVIFSDENNRGKTLLVQSLMYALGNSPIFPSTFDDYNHFFYVEIKTGVRFVEIIRRSNDFSVIIDEELKVFNSVSDFKHFFDTNIFRLPRYRRTEGPVVADLALFFQLFFLPQDKRNTSNTINHGFTNKEDFVEMIKAFAELPQSESPSADKAGIKAEIAETKRRIARLKRRSQFAVHNPDIAIRVQAGYSGIHFQEFEDRLRAVNKQISALTSRRYRELNRKIKLENLVDELRSLNQTIEVGNVKCGECGSDKIVYSSGDLVFEITNDVVRRQILSAIGEQIVLKDEAVKSYSDELARLQLAHSELLKEMPTEIGDMIIYRDEILNQQENDAEIFALQVKFDLLQSELAIAESLEGATNELGNQLLARIVSAARQNYKAIDPDSDVYFDSLFTKFTETYSGSEAQIFYYSKLKAISEVLALPFPVVVDSFREGELSTEKEHRMLDGYKTLRRQVVLTSTLKAQEYSDKKYDGIERVHPIDYSSIPANRILSTEYAPQFRDILSKFNLTSSST